MSLATRGWWSATRRRGNDGQQASIKLLPFANMSGDQDLIMHDSDLDVLCGHPPIHAFLKTLGD